MAICNLCPEGSFQDEDGQDSCKPCPSGTYADNTGFKKCIPCPYRLSSQEGSATCPFCCDEEFYLASRNTNATEIFSNPSEHCLNCPANAKCESNIVDVEGIQLIKDNWHLSKMLIVSPNASRMDGKSHPNGVKHVTG